MEIKVIPARPEQLKEKPKDESKLGFGDIYSDICSLWTMWRERDGLMPG